MNDALTARIVELLRQLIKSLTTIDRLSNGRVDCGLGARWHDIEAKALGDAFPSIGPREDMLEEYAQIMRLLLDPEAEVVREDSTPTAAT